MGEKNVRIDLFKRQISFLLLEALTLLTVLFWFDLKVHLFWV